LERLKDQLIVAHIADHERNPFGHGPAEPGRKIIEHNRLESCIEQPQNHVAADVPGPSGDENVHGIS
jgi:hypothetical protein